MIIMWLAVLCAVVGALMFALSTNPTLKRIGEILLFWGIGVTLLVAGGKTVVHLP